VSSGGGSQTDMLAFCYKKGGFINFADGNAAEA
jgi:hypothetical protein